MESVSERPQGGGDGPSWPVSSEHSKGKAIVRGAHWWRGSVARASLKRVETSLSASRLPAPFQTPRPWI